MPTEIEYNGEKLLDTDEQIVHRGRTFRICHTKDRRADTPYVLIPVSGRGHGYILTRNRPNPTMMFGVSWVGLKSLDGWFTDKDGSLKSCG